jgi:hypothetical protein
MLTVRYVAAASLVLILITSLPYLWGYLSKPPDMWFSGVIYNVHDTAQYLTWMRESGTRFFIENKLTPEPNPAVFVNLHWWIPGRVAAWLGLSLRQMYQILRLLVVPLYVAVLYWVCGLFCADLRRRRFAFWFATLGSGLGWIWVVDKYLNRLGDVRWPHDVYTTPGNSFWVLLASPHLAFALALTCLVLGLAWLGYEKRRWSLSLAAGGLALFLGLGHVYDLVTVWSVLAVFGLLLTLRDGFRWRTFASLSVVVIASLPASLYFGWVSSAANPLWQAALKQYDNLGAFTPRPLHLVVLLGVPLLLALAGFFLRVGRLARQSDRSLFLGGWFVVQLVIIYLPLQFQVMLLAGFQLVMAILATDFVFERMIPWLEARFRERGREGRLFGLQPGRWVSVLLLLAVVPTNAYLFSWRLMDLNRHDRPFYLYQDEVAAMEWLESQIEPGDVVLSSFVIGHYIPGLTGGKAFCGNAVMTADFERKREMMERFFDAATSDVERMQLVQQYNVRYVFWGPAERELGSYDLDASSWLSRVFSNSRVSVYRVNQNSM